MERLAEGIEDADSGLPDPVRELGAAEPRRLELDARLERDTDVRFETVALDDVLAATAGASLRMVILDVVPEQPAGAVDAADKWLVGA